MVHFSDALRLMLSPVREYRARVARSADGSWPRALRSAALLALLFAAVTSIAATGRITAMLFASSLASWIFVPILQLATAFMLARSVRSAPVTLSRRIELLFDGHGAWSLWLVGVAAWLMVSPNQLAALVTAVVPAALTARVLAAFCREVLKLPPAAAWIRVAAHQALTAALVLIYVELTTHVSSRFVGGAPS